MPQPNIGDEHRVLRIDGQGGVEAALLADFLVAITRAYNGALLFDQLVPSRDEPSRRRWWRDLPLWELPLLPWAAAATFQELSDPEWVASTVLPPDRLVVGRVDLKSPGVWDFIGKLNPLEVIRQYLVDRHQRRQDREYREDAEVRRLGLENDLLEIRVIRERIALAREAGVPDEALAPLVDHLLGRPLDRLGAHQDRGVIDAREARIEQQLPPSRAEPGQG